MGRCKKPALDPYAGSLGVLLVREERLIRVEVDLLCGPPRREVVQVRGPLGVAGQGRGGWRVTHKTRVSFLCGSISMSPTMDGGGWEGHLRASARARVRGVCARARAGRASEDVVEGGQVLVFAHGDIQAKLELLGRVGRQHKGLGIDLTRSGDQRGLQSVPRPGQCAAS